MADLMQQARELLPCPFCGSADSEMQQAQTEHYVECLECEASTALLSTRREARELWNRRAALRAAPEWQPMEAAPRDGTVVLVAIGGSDIPQPCRFRDRVGWVIAWDEWRIPAHDGPLGWMPLPATARPQGVKDAT